MEKWKSRKFFLALIGVVSVTLSELFGLNFNAEAIAGLAAMVGLYIVAEALVDRKAVEATAAATAEHAFAALSQYAQAMEAQLQEIMETEETNE